MKKNNGSLIISLVAVLFLAAFWAWQEGLFKSFSEERTDSVLEEEARQEESAENIFIPQINEKRIDEQTKRYSIEIRYPSIIGLEDVQVSEEISRYFKDKAEKAAQDFKKDEAENAIEEIEAQSQLISSCQPFWHNNSFLSIKTETMYYVRGMAHPSTYISVFNYDIINKKQLELGDFFNPGSDYLEEISVKAKEEVKKKAGEYYNEFMANEGTSPKKENYENFLFDKTGLTFVFSQYQAAPYAAGIISVKIPYSELLEHNGESETVKKITTE